MPEPSCFLPSSARLFRSLISMPVDRARQELDVADHAHAVGGVGLAAAAHGELLLGVGQFALELAALVHQLSEALRQIFKRRFKFRRRRLRQFAQVMRGLARGRAGERLDAAHAGRDAAVGQPAIRPMSPVRRTWVPPHSSTDQPRVLPPVPSGFWPIATTRTSSPYFSPNSARAPDARASSSAISRVVTGEFCITKSLAMSSTCSISSRRHRLGMREVEAQPVGRDQRALLRDVIAQHLAQRLVQQMRRGMVLADGAAPRVIDVERQRGAGLERALLDRADMRRTGRRPSSACR